jgi:hypothetical protein
MKPNTIENLQKQLLRRTKPVDDASGIIVVPPERYIVIEKIEPEKPESVGLWGYIKRVAGDVAGTASEVYEQVLDAAERARGEGKPRRELTAGAALTRIAADAAEVAARKEAERV